MQVATGQSSSYALLDDGSIWAWGYNGHGELGDGTTTDQVSPVRINAYGADTGMRLPYGSMPGYEDDSVDGHGFTMFVVRPDGTVVGSGWNAYGQLGAGSDDMVTAATMPQLGINVVQIARGETHTLVLKHRNYNCIAGLPPTGYVTEGSDASTATIVPQLGAISCDADGADNVRDSFAEGGDDWFGTAAVSCADADGNADDSFSFSGCHQAKCNDISADGTATSDPFHSANCDTELPFLKVDLGVGCATSTCTTSDCCESQFHHCAAACVAAMPDWFRERLDMSDCSYSATGYVDGKCYCKGTTGSGSDGSCGGYSTSGSISSGSSVHYNQFCSCLQACGLADGNCDAAAGLPALRCKCDNL